MVARPRLVRENLVRFGVPGTPYLTPRPSLGAGFLPPQDPAQVLFQRRQKRLVSWRSAGMLVGTEQFYVLFPNHPGEEGTPVGSQRVQGSDPHQGAIPGTPDSGDTVLNY